VFWRYIHMSGVIYFKLKNAIQQQQVNFDGSVIQIGDVKRLVAQKQGLGPEGAAELTLYDPNTGDEYTDDGKVIPRNTLVLVKRAPATRFKPLVSSAIGAPTTAPTAPQPAPAPPATAGDDFGGDSFTNKQAGGEEDQALASYLQNSAAGWHREVMQGAQRGRGGRGRGRGAPPMDYRCPR
jgi:protein MPE1